MNWDCMLVNWFVCSTSMMMVGLSVSAWTALSKVSSHVLVSPSILSSLAKVLLVKVLRVKVLRAHLAHANRLSMGLTALRWVTQVFLNHALFLPLATDARLLTHRLCLPPVVATLLVLAR